MINFEGYTKLGDIGIRDVIDVDVSAERIMEQINDIIDRKKGKSVVWSDESLVVPDFNVSFLGTDIETTNGTIITWYDLRGILLGTVYEQTMSEMDVNEYGVLYSKRRCKDNYPEIRRPNVEGAVQIIAYKGQVDGVEIIEVREIGSGRMNNIPCALFKKQKIDWKKMYKDAMREQLLQERVANVDELKEKKRQLLREFADLERQLHMQVSDEDMDEYMDTLWDAVHTTSEDMCQRYPALEGYSIEGKNIFITFAPGFEGKFGSEGKPFKYNRKTVFKVSMDMQWDVRLHEGAHIHCYSASGELCKGGLSKEIVSALASRNVFYIIELLHAYMENVGIVDDGMRDIENSGNFTLMGWSLDD